jgi:hypothetical protein
MFEHNFSLLSDRFLQNYSVDACQFCFDANVTVHPPVFWIGISDQFQLAPENINFASLRLFKNCCGLLIALNEADQYPLVKVNELFRVPL